MVENSWTNVASKREYRVINKLNQYSHFVRIREIRFAVKAITRYISFTSAFISILFTRCIKMQTAWEEPHALVFYFAEIIRISLESDKNANWFYEKKGSNRVAEIILIARALSTSYKETVTSSATFSAALGNFNGFSHHSCLGSSNIKNFAMSLVILTKFQRVARTRQLWRTRADNR